jgi:hypothetical protein
MCDCIYMHCILCCTLYNPEKMKPIYFINTITHLFKNPLEFERSDVNELFIEMLDILLIEHII